MLPSGDGNSNSDGLFQLSPTQNASAGTSFFSEALRTLTYLTDMNTLTQQTITELYLIIELSRFAAALENFHARLQISMNCLLNAQLQTGVNLEVSGEDTTTVDTQLATMFQQIEPSFIPPYPVLTPNLMPSITPATIYPGFDTTPALTPGMSNTWKTPMWDWTGNMSNINPSQWQTWSGSSFAGGQWTSDPLLNFGGFHSHASNYTSALTSPDSFGLNNNLWSIYQLP
jgi:hypothetical protein